MSLSIIKGQKTDITKNNPSLGRIVVAMGWTATTGVDLDLSVFVLQANGKVSSDQDLIFYSNPSGANGAVQLAGQALKAYGSQTDKEQVNVQLSQIPKEVERVPFTLTIYEGDRRRQNFSLVNDAYIRVIDEASGNELFRYELGKNFPVETAIVVGELYRYGAEWKFNAIGSGYSGGLSALCGSFGVDVREEPKPAQPAQAAPKPPVVQAPLVQPPVSPPSTIRLDKIELRKKGEVINLQKNSGSLGEILVNLNWNRKKSGGGLFKAASGVDLDLGCLYELKDGTKGGVQALGNAFGDLNNQPFVALDGDDRTGALAGGENLRINGARVADIERIVVFAFIYEGVANWSQADGVVTIKQSGGPDIEVRMDEHNNSKGLCAIAMIKNVNNQTFSIERLVQFFGDQQELDKAYQWGLRWSKGKK